MSSTEEAIAQARKAVEPDKPKHVLRTLGKSIREYKKASLLAPALVAVEGILEILIPTIMASLIDEGITGGSMPSTIKFGVILLICAMVSLGAGFLSGKFAAIAGAASPRTCARTSSRRFRLQLHQYRPVLHRLDRDPTDPPT